VNHVISSRSMGLLRLLAALGATAGLVWAQSPQASVSGTVRDSQGAVIAHAEIVALSVATAASTSARTNESGFYSLRNLPIGEYTFTVTQPGFRRYQQQGLTLTTGQSLQRDIAL
jgi:hypothetical protein